MKIGNNGMVSKLLKDVKIPKMFRAIQQFNKESILPEDIENAVWEELGKIEFSSKIKPKMNIAITAGSRGIRNVDIITRSIVRFVKEKGANPFIVPAMGSHGGATAEGQLDVLAGYNITEETMGCPIKSSMEVVELGISSRNKKVYMDKNAYESDGVIISCRLKPHNAFRGKVESGPCKMMTVGLGKQAGASLVHSDGMNHIAENIPTMAEVVINSGKILFAIPCLENAYDETFKIEAILPEDILRREPELLKLAFKHMPKILVEESDVLVVDEIGKNYSGTGVDPNITGTFSTPYASGGLKVQRTCFLDLSEESHGNSLGVGLASAITKKFFEKIDTEAMYPNCITSTVLASARIPCVVANDKEAIQICIKTCNEVDYNHIRMVRISNSLHIGEIMLSEEYYKDVLEGKYEGVIAKDSPKELEFDESGNLLTKIKYE
nr:lactate racemase domain-containing protein [uncultured Lachnoanaerobaculum sp.]